MSHSITQKNITATVINSEPAAVTSNITPVPNDSFKNATRSSPLSEA